MLEDATSGFYNPNQFKIVVPYFEGKPPPKWLLLGGPGSANEMQTAREYWPTIRGIGVDVNPNVLTWQIAHGWPTDCSLVQAALHDKLGFVGLSNAGSDLLHGCVYHPEGDGDKELAASLPKCPTTTWDHLDSVYGPFEDSILWMDIEGSEFTALVGATGLFTRRAVRLINLEILVRVEEPCSVERPRLIHEFLTSYGFLAVKDWNESIFCRDRIYVLRD